MIHGKKERNIYNNKFSKKKERKNKGKEGKERKGIRGKMGTEWGNAHGL